MLSLMSTTWNSAYDPVQAMSDCILDGWTIPSVSKLDKMPTIEFTAVNLLCEYRDWFNTHKEIPRCIPPLYQDFCIRYKLQFGEREHDYIDIVHYNDELTALAACHCIDGKKVLFVESHYLDYDGANIKSSLRVPAKSRYSEDWLKNEAVATIFAVLGVQAYLLYHRPDIVPVFVDAKPSAKRKPAKAQPRTRTVSNIQKRYIRIGADDKPPRIVNYKAIQWTVRGHYRRITDKDGNRRMIYIKPHTAKRGKKKITAARILIKEETK